MGRLLTIVGLLTTLFITSILKAEEASVKELKVMTLNLWGNDNYDRIPTIAAYLNSHPSDKPDFIALCEVSNSFGSGSNYQSDAKFLGQLLGHKSNWTYHELGILSKYPTAYKNNGQARTWSFELKTWSRIQRYLLVADFKVPNYGFVRVASIHLSHEDNDFSPQYTHVRLNQMKIIMNHLHDLQKQYPVESIFMAGDFNASPKEIKKHHHDFMRFDIPLLKDKKGLFSFEDYNNHQVTTWQDIDGHYGQDPIRLDYVFVSDISKTKKLSFREEKILFKDTLLASPRVNRDKGNTHIYVSDHAAVLHTYQVK